MAKRKSTEQTLKEIYEFTQFVLKSKEIPEKYKKRCLDGVLWDMTEINGKQNVRYKSKKALTTDGKTNHEHVVTKKYLIKKLIDFPELYKEILSLAISCIVTEDEHKNKLNIKGFEGWERYKVAGVKVMDLFTGKEANLEELIASQKTMFDKLNNK